MFECLRYFFLVAGIGVLDGKTVKGIEDDRCDKSREVGLEVHLKNQRACLVFIGRCPSRFKAPASITFAQLVSATLCFTCGFD
jgi:hypothetical protein